MVWSFTRRDCFIFSLIKFVAGTIGRDNRIDMYLVISERKSMDIPRRNRQYTFILFYLFRSSSIWQYVTARVFPCDEHFRLGSMDKSKRNDRHA